MKKIYHGEFIGKKEKKIGKKKSSENLIIIKNFIKKSLFWNTGMFYLKKKSK